VIEHRRFRPLARQIPPSWCRWHASFILHTQKRPVKEHLTNLDAIGSVPTVPDAVRNRRSGPATDMPYGPWPGVSNRRTYTQAAVGQSGVDRGPL